MNLLAGVEQDFHRPQKSPGAYEWWHFDGTDEKTGYSFVIQFHAGNLFSAYYQDSLRTYWKKTKSPLVDPARSPEAPNPLDYCGVSFRLFHKDRMVAESLQEFSQKSLKASDRHGAVLLGPNRFNWDQRGEPPSYVLTAQAPLQGRKTTVRARLFFTPLSKSFPAFPKPEIPSTHTWVLAAPLCHVEGTLEWVNSEGETKKETAFVGKGYHDHHIGSVPLDRFVKAWHWGRAFMGDSTLVYSVQIPPNDKEPIEGFLLATDSNKTNAWRVAFKLSKRRWNIFGLSFQRTLEFADTQSLKVDHRQVLSEGPAYLIFEDKVQWSGDGTSLVGSGLSNLLYSPRLSNPLFFPMLKGKSLIMRPSGDSTLPPPSSDVSTTRPTL